MCPAIPAPLPPCRPASGPTLSTRAPRPAPRRSALLLTLLRGEPAAATALRWSRSRRRPWVRAACWEALPGAPRERHSSPQGAASWGLAREAQAGAPLWSSRRGSGVVEAGQPGRRERAPAERPWPEARSPASPRRQLSRSPPPGARPAAGTGALPPPLAAGALLLVGSVAGLVLLARSRARAPWGATAPARDGQTAGAVASHRRIEML